MVSTATLSPCTTLSTPSGSPASWKSFARKIDALGSFSEGFSTTVLPHAIAEATIHSGTITGKLNGVMQPTTPTGCFVECTSTPRATCSECSPFSRLTRPAANSTFSMPREISPAASDRTFPCSLVSTAASSGVRSFSSWRRRKNTSARLMRPVERQPGSAAAAAAMACSTSATDAKATSCCRSPVAGLNTGPVRSASATSRPAMKCWMRAISADSLSFCVTDSDGMTEAV